MNAAPPPAVALGPRIIMAAIVTICTAGAAWLVVMLTAPTIP